MTAAALAQSLTANVPTCNRKTMNPAGDDHAEETGPGAGSGSGRLTAAACWDHAPDLRPVDFLCRPIKSRGRIPNKFTAWTHSRTRKRP